MTRSPSDPAVGELWSYLEPTMFRRKFRISHIGPGPRGVTYARGKDEQGRKVMCPVSRLRAGAFGARKEDANDGAPGERPSRGEPQEAAGAEP
jgi:hypothetical protein